MPVGAKPPALRPAEVEARSYVGHWEADNGTEFHDYKRAERLMGAAFYFARPYHSWEGRSNENTNGLLRQYPPKGMSMVGLSQQQCNAIAGKLNTRPRRRLASRCRSSSDEV